MRLIDADVLKQHIDKLPALPDGNFAGNHSALKALINMQPTFEPSTNCSEVPNSSDAISRQAAIDALDKRFDSIPMEQTVEVLQLRRDLRELPPAQSEQQWIPCSKKLPEEDTEVLISYRYKEGEGDTDHVNIDITSYGTTCFGGREIHTLKEWRQPFDYFHANYEVIAWMPLPTPYREE